MWFEFAATLLVATSCVNAQAALTAAEVGQFGTNSGRCNNQYNSQTIGYIEAELVGNRVIIETNHVPNHEWQSVNPNYPKASVKDYVFAPPQRLADSQVGCLPLGMIGIAKNGVYIFSPTTSNGGNAKLLETMDNMGGHVSPQQQYHYHSPPANGVLWDSGDQNSQFYGIAIDGYPIYTEGNDVDTTQLDICNGIDHANGYRYIARKEHYPYFLGCFRGEVQFQRNRVSASCSKMAVGNACTCTHGVKNGKRSLLDLFEEVIEEEKMDKSKRRKGGSTGCVKTHCGVNSTEPADFCSGGKPGGGRQRSLDKRFDLSSLLGNGDGNSGSSSGSSTLGRLASGVLSGGSGNSGGGGGVASGLLSALTGSGGNRGGSNVGTLLNGASTLLGGNGNSGGGGGVASGLLSALTGSGGNRGGSNVGTLLNGASTLLGRNGNSGGSGKLDSLMRLAGSVLGRRSSSRGNYKRDDEKLIDNTRK